MNKKEIIEIIEGIEYNDSSEWCGLEDSWITDRYEAMEYGWNRALESVIEMINSN